jgi:hypothetical protein
LAEGFQRGRLKCEKLTDDRRRMGLLHTGVQKNIHVHCIKVITYWYSKEHTCTLYYISTIKSSFIRVVSIFLAHLAKGNVRFCHHLPSVVCRPLTFHILISCLLTDRKGMSILYREPSIDASYQVSVHLAKRFQRRRFLEIGQSETRMACGGHVYFFSHTILFMGLH